MDETWAKKGQKKINNNLEKVTKVEITSRTDSNTLLLQSVVLFWKKHSVSSLSIKKSRLPATTINIDLESKNQEGYSGRKKKVYSN